MSTTTELVTIRDFLRFAVSSFSAAKLVHGHGASSALEEAAFIILETLHLPVDDINPWLDARLLKEERTALAQLINTRIKSRKPAAYLLKKTYMQGVPFYVDERVIVPRSYLGELLAHGLPEVQAENIQSILDLCTGSGCLAILASNYFPDAQIDATDLSKDALAVASINIKNHGLAADITLHRGNLFEPVADRKYDLILANPPYVAKSEIKVFPPEYKAEPVMAHLGGIDGLDIVRSIMREARGHLNPGGSLVCEIGTGRDIIMEEFPDHDLFWFETENSSGEVFMWRNITP